MTLERIRGALLPFIYQIHKKFSTIILIWQRFITLKTKSNCLLLCKLHLFLRVDPTAACKENRETPIEISKKSSTEMRRLLSKFTEMPEHIKLHHLSELMFNNEEKDNVKEEFKEILGTLPVKLVRLEHWPNICFVLCKYEHIDHYMRTYAIVIGVHPNSHKHFIPYMGFCASIWDSVRHHCHHHLASSWSSKVKVWMHSSRANLN